MVQMRLSNETIMESKKMIIFFLTPIILVPFPHPKRFLSSLYLGSQSLESSCQF